MKIAALVYQQYFTSTGVQRKLWFIIRKLLIHLLGDPICSLPIHGRCLKLPLSHLLPMHLAKYPFYDRLPQRISAYIHQKQGYLNCIDIGANIGDSIAAFYQKDTDKFLAIEPNPKFNKLLLENWDWNKNITFISDVCSSHNDQTIFSVLEENGTSSIVLSDNGIKMNRRTLDEIVKDLPSALNANVLKIDTDGHDFEVIAGSKCLLKTLPVVLFECEVFGNTNYVEDCIETLKFFKQSGYESFLLYDNYGNLMGKYSLSELSPFRNLLFFQLTSENFYYFDILIMRDEDLSSFYQAEIDYFGDKMSNQSLRRTAIAAIQL